jgi:isohexenylglutaconyl-CoA hydratase
MGGGFGLACVADVTIAAEGARFRLPETGLGLVPAQIAPFVARKIGVSQARRLALAGDEVGAAEAVHLGLAHHHTTDVLETTRQVVRGLLRSEPTALAATKALLLGLGGPPLDATLDTAAAIFAARAHSETAAAGFAAFLTRKPAPWAEEPE